MASFTSLPFEIRDMVYRLLLVYDRPVQITSPASSHKCRPCCHSSNFRTDFANLSRVNKHVNAEACVVFYSLNTFQVSNEIENYHSPHFANFHALREFIRRTPAEKIRLIRRICFCMRITPGHEFRGDGSGHSSKTCLKDIESMSRSLGRHFRGIESLRIFISGGYYRERYCSCGRHLLSPPDAIPGIGKAIKTLLKLEKLKEITCSQKSVLGTLPEFVDNTLRANPATKRNVEVVIDSRWGDESRRCSL
jgi:hypothetical protein